jgi:WXG100 family type VII secretion target
VGAVEPGGDQTSVDAEAVRVSVGQLSDVREELEDGLRATTRAVHDLIEGVWKGEASGKFSDNFETFVDAAAKILQDANSIEELVVSSMNTYERTDRSSSDTFQAAPKLNL